MGKPLGKSWEKDFDERITRFIPSWGVANDHSENDVVSTNYEIIPGIHTPYEDDS